MQGYCSECKKTVEIKDMNSVKLPNNKRVTKGKCSICETEIWKKET